MIKLKEVSYKNILSSTTINFPKNKLTALIGPNGAGKSTLISIIARLLPLETGEIIINDLNISKTPSIELAKQVSFFQQNIQLMSRLKVEELIMIARFPYHRGWPSKKDKEICNKMIHRFSLEDIRHKFLDHLSGGQRQRALIAMVFAQDTPVIILDEPLNNLDIKHAQELMICLRNAVNEEKKTILLVIHDVNYASKYADYIVAMKDGAIIDYGDNIEMLTAKKMSQLFDINVQIEDNQHQKFCLYY